MSNPPTPAEKRANRESKKTSGQNPNDIAADKLAKSLSKALSFVDPIFPTREQRSGWTLDDYNTWILKNPKPHHTSLVSQVSEEIFYQDYFALLND
jgi:hypothetical protein